MSMLIICTVDEKNLVKYQVTPFTTNYIFRELRNLEMYYNWACKMKGEKVWRYLAHTTANPALKVQGEKFQEKENQK